MLTISWTSSRRLFFFFYFFLFYFCCCVFDIRSFVRWFVRPLVYCQYKRITREMWSDASISVLCVPCARACLRNHCLPVMVVDAAAICHISVDAIHAMATLHVPTVLHGVYGTAAPTCLPSSLPFQHDSLEYSSWLHLLIVNALDIFAQQKICQLCQFSKEQQPYSVLQQTIFSLPFCLVRGKMSEMNFQYICECMMDWKWMEWIFIHDKKTQKFSFFEN